MAKHYDYIKHFVFLAIVPATIALFYQDSRGPDHIIPPKGHDKCCYMYKLDDDFDDGEEPSDFIPIVYFAYQLSFFSLLSFIFIIGIMIYTWRIMEEEEEDEGFEHRLVSCLGFITSLECMSTVIIFDFISRNCVGAKSHRELLIAMAVVNFVSTMFDRGFGVAYRLFRKSREMRALMDNMKTLDEDAIENEEDATCVICDDDIEDTGKLALCGHMYHTFCIKEWIAEYGPNCPDCNKDLRINPKGLVIDDGDDDEEDDPDNPKLDPGLVSKIYEEMSKFDQRSTFFTENSDKKEKKKDDDDEEEESDDD